MARGFGTTDGLANSDRIRTALISSSVLRSYSAWFWITGAGGVGTGSRIWDRDQSTGFYEYLLYDSANGNIQFARQWTTTSGQWTIPLPSTAAWHQILVAYDASSASNAPLIWVDGVAQTVTTLAAPVGSLTTSPLSAFWIGNDASANQNWSGRIAEAAIWDALLVQADATLLATGLRAGSAQPANLAEWVPLDNDPVTSRILAQPTITGTVLMVDPASLHYELGKPSASTIAAPLGGEAAGLANQFGAAAALPVGALEGAAASTVAPSLSTWTLRIAGAP